MGASKIPYLTRVWNPITGCSPISEGCHNCWAQNYLVRFGQPARPVYHLTKVTEPWRWHKPQVIGVCFLGDLFHEDVKPWMWKEIFDTILHAPQHTFLMLTKRPDYAACWMGEWPENVWLGVSVEDQAAANERMPILRYIPARHRWVSIEPQLGSITEALIERGWSSIEWMVCGCESGRGARPFSMDWARILRDECHKAAIPFFFKQSPRADGRGVVVMPWLDGRPHDDLPWKRV